MSSPKVKFYQPLHGAVIVAKTSFKTVGAT
jgi:hypothetical protein